MKKIILSMMTVLLMSGMVMAQHAHRNDKMPDPKIRAERMAEQMAKEYALNDTQKKQLLEVNLAMVEKRGNIPMTRKSTMKRGKGDCNEKDCTCCNSNKDKKKVGKADKKEGKRAQLTDEQRTQMKADREKKREEMQVARAAYHTQLQKIMTKEQYTAYSQNMQHREAKREVGRREVQKN